MVSARGNKLIRVITGIRRSGKSYLFDLVFKIKDNDIYLAGSNAKFLSSDIVIKFRKKKY